MTKDAVRSAIIWLNTNGFENDVEEFLYNLDSLNNHAVSIGFSSNPDDWSSILQRKCRKMQKLDTLYFSRKNEHIFRTFNAMDKEDMLEWIHEINQMVNI